MGGLWHLLLALEFQFWVQFLPEILSLPPFCSTATPLSHYVLPETSVINQLATWLVGQWENCIAASKIAILVCNHIVLGNPSLPGE